MATPVALDRVTPVALEPDQSLVLHGLVTTSLDGSSFSLAPVSGAPSGNLFDFAAGGFHVVASHPERQECVVAWNGELGSACVAAHVESPCLLPRTGLFAHERLRTIGEFLGTLSGSIEMETGPAVVRPGKGRGAIVSMLTIGLLGVAAAAFILRVAVPRLRRRARSGLVRVRAAARDALRATRGDATLEPVRPHVRGMVVRATNLERHRRACERKLSRMDLADVERRSVAHRARAAQGDPGSIEALDWISAERADAERTRRERDESAADIDRIETALRVMTLRMRERGDNERARARRRGGDPVAQAAAELVYRDQAHEEVERAVNPAARRS